MDKSIFFVHGVIGFAFIVYLLFSALFGIIIAAGFGFGIWIWAKKTGAWIFMKPLASRGGALNLYITDMGEILVEEMERTGEKFLKFKDSFGIIEVTPNSDYTMFGKPACISVEGVDHTVTPEKAEMTRKLAKLGYDDFHEARENLKEGESSG